MAKPAKRRIQGNKSQAGKSAEKSPDKGAENKANRAKTPPAKNPGAKNHGAKVQGGRAHHGRVTPKAGSEHLARNKPDPSSRYTPPIPQSEKISPPWIPVLMFSLAGIGLIVIFLNYMGLLPNATSNWYLVVGLGFILGGILTATQYH